MRQIVTKLKSLCLQENVDIKQDFRLIIINQYIIIYPILDMFLKSSTLLEVVPTNRRNSGHNSIKTRAHLKLQS